MKEHYYDFDVEPEEAPNVPLKTNKDLATKPKLIPEDIATAIPETNVLKKGMNARAAAEVSMSKASKAASEKSSKPGLAKSEAAKLQDEQKITADTSKVAPDLMPAMTAAQTTTTTTKPRQPDVTTILRNAAMTKNQNTKQPKNQNITALNSALLIERSAESLVGQIAKSFSQNQNTSKLEAELASLWKEQGINMKHGVEELMTDLRKLAPVLREHPEAIPAVSNIGARGIVAEGRAAAAEQRATAETSRADAAEQRATAATIQAQAAEARAATAGQRAEAATARAQAAEARAAAAEQKAAAAMARATAAEQRADAATARAESAEKMLAAAKAAQRTATSRNEASNIANHVMRHAEVSDHPNTLSPPKATPATNREPHRNGPTNSR